MSQTTQQPTADDTTEQPQKSHLKATLILACLAQFMVILDVSVVNVALPSIKHALNFTEDGLQWVVNAYTVTFAGFLLLGGRAADLLGRRRVFVFGLRALLARFARGRPGGQPHGPDRRAPRPGSRRRRGRARLALDPHEHLHRARRSATAPSASGARWAAPAAAPACCSAACSRTR